MDTIPELQLRISAHCKELEASLVGAAGANAVALLDGLLCEHRQLLSKLSAPVVSEEYTDAATTARARERVLTDGLAALGSVATSMRAVLDDVAELMPADNGNLPSVQDIITYAHRLRYTTFATTGLYSGEPAPLHDHFERSGLWMHAQAERHQAMAAARGGGGQPAAAEADPRAQEVAGVLFHSIISGGWSPDMGPPELPEPVLLMLGTVAGAREELERMLQAHTMGAAAGVGGAREGQPEAAAAAAAAAPVAAAAPARAAAAPRTAEARLVDDLIDRDDSDDDSYESSDDDD